MAGAAAAASAAASAAAAAALAPPLDSRWPSSTTEAQTSAALSRADATAYPGLPATCSDRSPGASVGTFLLGSDISPLVRRQISTVSVACVYGFCRVYKNR